MLCADAVNGHKKKKTCMSCIRKQPFYPLFLPLKASSIMIVFVHVFFLTLTTVLKKKMSSNVSWFPDSLAIIYIFSLICFVETYIAPYITTGDFITFNKFIILWYKISPRYIITIETFFPETWKMHDVILTDDKTITSFSISHLIITC